MRLRHALSRFRGPYGPINGAQRFRAIMGNGALTSFTVPHNLGRAVSVTVYDLSQSPPAEIGVEVQQEGVNAVIISAAAWESEAPAASSIEVLVLG
jgi:hypothetical protein